MDPEKVLEAEKQAAAGRAQRGINTRMSNPSSCAINCDFFAMYLNSMARHCYRRSYRSTINYFDDLIQVIPISLLFTVCCMCDDAFVLTK